MLEYKKHLALGPMRIAGKPFSINQMGNIDSRNINDYVILTRTGGLFQRRIK